MIRPSRARVLSLLACSSLLASCAAEGGGPGRGPAQDAPPPGAVAREAGCGPLFVSPAGEPFRRGPDAATCPMRAWFDGADADHDGALTRTEFRDDALRFFAVLDADGNGYVDGSELQVYEHRIAPEILGRGGGPRAEAGAAPRLLPAALQLSGGMGGGGMGGMGGGGMGGGRGRGGGGGERPSGAGAERGELDSGAGLARFGLLGEPEPVAAADLDFDGRITRAEFATRADQRFRSLDEAEAGRLTYADVQRRLGERGRERPSGGRPSDGGGRGGGRSGRGARGGGPGGGFGAPSQL